MLLNKSSEWLYNVLVDGLQVVPREGNPGHYMITLKPVYLDKKFDAKEYEKILDNVLKVSNQYLEELKTEFPDIYYKHFDREIMKTKVFDYVKTL